MEIRIWIEHPDYLKCEVDRYDDDKEELIEGGRCPDGDFIKLEFWEFSGEFRINIYRIEEEEYEELKETMTPIKVKTRLMTLIDQILY